MLFPQLFSIINPYITSLQGKIMAKKFKAKIDYDSLIGRKFNKWSVLSYQFKKNRIHLNCICECGITSFIQASAIIYGHSKKCKQCNLLLNGTKKIHGLYGTPTNRTWNALRNRCNNPMNKDYSRYGGRGIKVCERWNLFENFLSDMGEKPKGLSIDRIDNNGNYEPANCRWATVSQQNSNQRPRKYRPRKKIGV